MSIVKPAYGILVNPSLAISSGLVGAWLFNDGSGTTAHDSSGTGAHGTLTGASAPTWQTGAYGGTALLFPGAPNVGYVAIPPIAALFSPLVTQSVVIGVKSNGGNGNNGRLIDLQSVGDASGQNVNNIRWTDNVSLLAFDANGKYITSSVAPAPNVQSVVATTKNNTAGVLYLNSTATAGTINDGNNANHITVGDRGSRTGSHTFGGYIEFVYLYNRVLSPTEIAQLNAAPFAPYVTSSKSLFFKLK